MTGNRFIIYLLTTIWLLVSWYSLAYANSGDPKMSGGCPMMLDKTMLCPLNLAQHIDRWCNIFTTIGALGLFIIVLLFARRNFNELLNAIAPNHQRQRWRQRLLLIVGPLQRFLNRGLLQPILYA